MPHLNALKTLRTEGDSYRLRDRDPGGPTKTAELV
jgi:hypothetical protein